MLDELGIARMQVGSRLYGHCGTDVAAGFLSHRVVLGHADNLAERIGTTWRRTSFAPDGLTSRVRYVGAGPWME
jgi:hypothetical protein